MPRARKATALDTSLGDVKRGHVAAVARHFFAADVIEAIARAVVVGHPEEELRDPPVARVEEQRPPFTAREALLAELRELRPAGAEPSDVQAALRAVVERAAELEAGERGRGTAP